MKILVTGSSGHLGEALVRTLQNTNHEVISRICQLNCVKGKTLWGTCPQTQ
jgi:dTDP-4-dehydrorhamnose reductase